MKRMKPEKKRLIISIIAFLLIATMVVGLIAPFIQGAEIESNGIDINANVGFEGYAKINRECFFEVELSNNSGKDFEGEVQVLLPNFDYSYLYGSSREEKYRAVGEKIELSNGSIKKVELSGVINSIANDVTIRLVDNKDRIVATKKVPITIREDDKLWYAVISDNKDTIAYMKPQYYGFESYDFIINNKNLSENMKAIQDINCIVINDYDTGEFTDGQIEALRKWTGNGGVLIIGTGKNREKVMDNLKFAENGDIFYGDGRIYLYDDDLGDENFSNAKFQSDIVNIYNSIDLQNGTYNYEDGLLGYTQTLPNYSDWLIVVIIVLIYGYIIFISPILYIILKKKDKREEALKIIPITAVGLTIFIYLLSFIAPYKNPIASVVSIIDLNKPDKNAIIGINMLSPESGTVKCEFMENNVNIEYIGDSTNYSYYYNYNKDNNSTADDKKIELKNKIINGEESYIEVYDKEKWGESYIGLRKEIGSVGELNVNGDFTHIFDFDLENNTGYDLEDVVIIYGNEYYNMGNIKNGEKIDLRTKSEDTKNVKTKVYDIELYNDRELRNFSSKENYKKKVHMDVLSSIQHDEGKIKIIGFNDSEIIEGGMKVNGDMPNMVTTNTFVYKPNAVVPSKLSFDDEEAWNDNIIIGYPTDYSMVEHADVMEFDNKYLYDENLHTTLLNTYEVKTSGDIEFEMEFWSEDKFIMIDISNALTEYGREDIENMLASYHTTEIYYPSSDLWVEADYYSGISYDVVKNENGMVRVRIKDCSEGEYIVAPMAIYTASYQ